MAAAVDPLQLLSAALQLPADSKEQADLLGTLRESLEARPNPIPILCTTLIQTVSNAGDSLLKRWVLDLLQFAICRSTLSWEARTNLAAQSLDVLAGLLHDPSPFITKIVVQCFATMYPLLFRSLCSNRNGKQQWDVLSTAKTWILEFVWAPHANAGVKLSALKFMQKVILVQTRGISDPRLQNKNDPNLSMCPADHPFIPVQTLESEGIKLLENIISILFNSNNVDVISAIINSWASLIKYRPLLVNLVVSTLASWTPAALAGQPASSIKSVEKSVRILLIHISRSANGSPHAAQIHEVLSAQAVRMEKAAAEDKARRNALQDASRKRPPSTLPEEPVDVKRQKLEHESAATATATAAASSSATAAASFLATVDFTKLPVSLITDLVVANLQAFAEPELTELVQKYRQSQATAQPPPLPISQPTVTVLPPPSRAHESEPESSSTVRVKEEPVDPLQMDIDEEEFEYEPDRLNQKLSGDGEMDMIMDEEAESSAAHDTAGGVGDGLTNLQLIDLKLPPPKEFSEEDRDLLIRASVSRIWNDADALKSATELSPASSAVDMWMLLVVRLVTRVAEPPPSEEEEEAIKEEEAATGIVEVNFYSHQDRLRQTLCDYVVQDFHSRLRLASTWMNEEWYNDRIRLARDPDWRPNYDIWLNQIVAAFQTHLDAKDKAFSRFLLDLPAVPTDIMDLLRDLCVDAERMQAGFNTLREFVTQRPTLRHQALGVLLDLTTHQEKVTRGAAINTIKRWVPDVHPMDGIVREFALQMLRRLQSRPVPESKHADMESNDDHDENMEDGQLPPEDIAHTPYLAEQLELPATRSQVLQHVELMFALTVKIPEFLDEIFAAYGQMDVSVQNHIQELITPLIRALGSTHGKLLTLMRTFPPGAESLALRVVNIFTETGRPSAQLVALVKGLSAERDLDARFLIPIIAEMDKADILRYLPRIVSILNNGAPEPNKLVRAVFNSVVATPPQSFGTVTSNMPRVRQSELLTPAELMVLLHESEKEIGLKSAIEAIGICFSMADIYRSEILAVVMQQIVDEPTLPTLFLRTVIQAVKTYKSLIGFVSTTLLSRLITKKIWNNGALWEGFIFCAKLIAPASYGALLQLPKDQLRDLVEKQPSLKGGLRDYVMKKAGNKARTAGYLDIFGEEDEQQSTGGDGSGIGQQQAVSVSSS